MSCLADLPELVGFFSYSREDDEAFSHALSAPRDGIQKELSAQLGRNKNTFRLWQDQEAIAAGLSLSSGSPVQSLALCMLAYFFSSPVSLAGMYLYVPELIPTRFRGLGVGAIHACVRLAGGLTGPLIVGTLTGANPTAIGLMLGLAALVAGTATWFLAVESKGKPLEQISP